MKIRLYLDEDTMGKGLVRALRSRAIEVVVAYDIGMAGREDAEHLSYSTSQDLVLYSFNRGDYMDVHTSLLESGLSHAGIVLGANNRYSIGEQMRRLVRLVETLSVEQMRDRVEFLSAWGCLTLPLPACYNPNKLRHC